MTVDTALFRTQVTAVLCSVLLLGACTTAQQPLTQKNSEITHGNVQMTLKKGVTTKNQVLETFGAPNITTRDAAEREVWTYQRSAQVSQSSQSSGYWTILIAGGSRGADGFESSSRMTTLIIKFDETDRVSDFRSRTSTF